MSLSKIITLWTVAVLLSVALLFPPFGYTRCVVFSLTAKTPDSESPISVPWTYIKHGFIFAAPPTTDSDLEARLEQGKMYAMDFTVSIGWRFVAIECAVILLLGVAAFATVGKFPN